jgi:hypothetical protein
MVKPLFHPGINLLNNPGEVLNFTPQNGDLLIEVIDLLDQQIPLLCQQLDQTDRGV